MMLDAEIVQLSAPYLRSNAQKTIGTFRRAGAIQPIRPRTKSPVDEVNRMIPRFRQNRRRWQLTMFAIVALLVLTPLLPATVGSPALAQDSDQQLGGTPLNFGNLVVINRPYASNGAQLALERFYVDRGLISDPYFSAVAGSGGTNPSANQQVPFRNPAPAFSRNLLITRNYGYSPFQTEPSIAVDPTDPDHIVVGVIDYNMGSTMSVYVSWDAGETWDGPKQIVYFRDDISGAGDPVVAFDREGTVYIAMITIGVREFVLGTISSQVTVLQMAVATSFDGGLSWSEPQLAAPGGVAAVSNVDAEGKERGTITTVDNDKPWMTVGPSPTDPDKDVIYLSYTEFEQTSSVLYADELAFLSSPFLATQIKVVASDDGGQTWSSPVPVSEKVFSGFSMASPGQDAAQQQTGEGTFTSRVVQGSQVDVLPDGTLAVCWYDSTDDGSDTGLATVGFATSNDEATSFVRRSWRPPIAKCHTGYVRPTSAMGRCLRCRLDRVAISISCNRAARPRILSTIAMSSSIAPSMAARPGIRVSRSTRTIPTRISSFHRWWWDRTM